MVVASVQLQQPGTPPHPDPLARTRALSALCRIALRANGGFGGGQAAEVTPLSPEESAHPYFCMTLRVTVRTWALLLPDAEVERCAAARCDVQTLTSCQNDRCLSSPTHCLGCC
jgi:hypothetical protein